MRMIVHLVKLCVGCDSIETLETWQSQYRDHGARHVTRQTPRRAGFGVGSSMYWVMGGVIRCRQRIASVDEVRGGDGILRCALSLDPELVATEPAMRRPFQGWRYLEAADAPRDISMHNASVETSMPPSMRATLSELRLI